MEQYIKKSAIKAEIERRIKECDKLANAAADNNLHNALEANELLIRQYTSLLNFLNSLEVKEDGVHGTVDYPLIGCDFPNIYPNYKELKEYCDRKSIKDNDKVKLIIIKDM